ncbi:hypothetical protein [Lonepinella sp. MS14436]|uniref:hypothetical protein n=1 Tax=Lonepinella sp. MS14436 TaxID=3003619 RepID=UPI0036DC7BB6
MKKQDNSNLRNAAISSGLTETVQRYGSANAEFLKGLRGIDFETGFKFDRSLIDVSNYKLNPDYLEKNLKQQAGFSAEIASVSKRNAQAIIDGSPVRVMRSEDIAAYGKNHNVVDIVEKVGNQEITSQMKFVTDPKSLLDKIAKGQGDGKNDLSRYLSVDKLELPTEQVEIARKYCQERIDSLEKQIKYLRTQPNSESLITKLEQEQEHFKVIKPKITDSGLTTDEAIQYRVNPRWETTKDIAKVSHEAGIQGAKFGMAIGGGISLITNSIAVYSGDKELSDALFDCTRDTLVSAGVGYGTGFTGAAIKSVMQQNSSVIMRNLAKTNLPSTVVSLCLATGKSITKYAKDEIDEKELLREMTGTVNGMMSGAMFATLGQIAIPIPVLGGLIGGMVGYTLSNTFYQGFLFALDEVETSKIRYAEISMKCDATRRIAARYQDYLNELFDKKLTELKGDASILFNTLESTTISNDDFIVNINRFAETLGKDLPIKNTAELDEFMLSAQALKL